MPWGRLLLVGTLALLLAVAGVVFLRARYGRRDLFDALWALAVHVSHKRLAAGLVASGLLVWLVAGVRSGARMAYPAAFAYLAGVLADATILFLLEPFGISFGPVLLPLTLLAGVRCALALGLGVLGWLLGHRGRTRARWPFAHLAAQALVLILVVDGLVIEPARLTVSQVRVPDPYRGTGPPIRIVQVSDLHVERWNDLAQRIVDTVNGLQPDLIVLTGDYLNTSFLNDPQSLADCRRLVAALRAKHGIYAIRGNADYGLLPERLFWDLPVTFIEDRWDTVEIGGRPLAVAGVSWHSDLDHDRFILSRLVDSLPRGCFWLLLYHSPDLAPEAATAGFELYTAGHTHGGQIRLPLYGALVTSSQYGKRYEMGPYRTGNALLYVSRGIGMEGWLVPRMRFLCPPEIVSYDLN